MNDTFIYRIELCGEADEDEINAVSPVLVSIELTGPGTCWLTVCTDHSGVIGLMRRLHGLGFVFLAMQRAERA